MEKKLCKNCDIEFFAEKSFYKYCPDCRVKGKGYKKTVSQRLENNRNNEVFNPFELTNRK